MIAEPAGQSLASSAFNTLRSMSVSLGSSPRRLRLFDVSFGRGDLRGRFPTSFGRHDFLLRGTSLFRGWHRSEDSLGCRARERRAALDDRLTLRNCPLGATQPSLYEDGSAEENWVRISNKFSVPCGYVVIECKNYKDEVANPELDQLAGRFSVNRGKLGLLICRSFENRALFVERCRDTFKDGQGLIVPLDDERVRTLLKHVETDRSGIDTALSSYVREIVMD